MRSEENTKYYERGKLFVFEGSDSVGKSTVATKVAENLSNKGFDVLLICFPGQEPKSLGKLVYDIHHDLRLFGLDRLSPTSLQLLHIAAHIDCIEYRILPALTKGKTVILDRYWWSTVAYGMAAGIPRKVLRAMIGLEQTVWTNVRPNKVFLLTREQPFRVELSRDMWLRVGNAYKILAHKEKNSYPVDVIENCMPLIDMVDTITSSILNGNSHESENSELRQEFLPMFFEEKVLTNKGKKDHWKPTKITEVFDTYWRFAAERQAIFFRRLKGEKTPWTKDPILRDYKFTNAYRASDRVSQFLIRHVIYEGDQEPSEIVFRTLLFKIFNKIETWKLFIQELGQISWREYNFTVYDQILTRAQEKKKSIYSAAYIMPSRGPSLEHTVKHRNHLQLLQIMMEDSLSARIADAKSMHQVFDLLRSYPMIGDFLAYQLATDINYSTITNFSEMSFVMPGPGARDGLQKCFSAFGGLSEVDIIKLMADRQEEEFERLGLQFENLWGRRLQLIDCQNLFCEVGKYARVAHPELRGLTGRSRIKQKFNPTPEPIEYFYPPKWNINTAMNRNYSVE